MTDTPVTLSAPEIPREQLLDPRTRRILLSLAAIGLFGPALVAWSSIVQLPFVGLIATVSCIACIAIVLAAISSTSEKAFARLDYLILTIAVVVLGAWCLTELYFYPAYGTDESAFVQYAANLQLHSHNPYGTNLLPALTQFRVPIQYATYKLDGTIASTLAYPALSFLIVIPGVLLTGGTQSIIAENALFLGLELILVFFFLPRPYRAIGVVLVLGLPFLFDYTLGGDIITFSLPFMLVVAYRWSDIGRGGRLGLGGMLSAICLGLAASITQFPWFVAPFLFLGLLRLRNAELGTRQALRTLVRFFSISIGVFLLINSPWLVSDPSSWVAGVLTPFTQHAIPFGQGLIDLTAFFRIGGGNLEDYTFAAVCVLVALLTIYFVSFRYTGRVVFVLPSLVFLFSTRSLSEYFIMIVALWMVSLASPGAAIRQYEIDLRTGPTGHRNGLMSRRWRALGAAVVTLPVVAAAWFLTLAWTTPAPLNIKIQSIQTNGQIRAIWKIKAIVSNSSSDGLTPHFATDASGYMTTFWNAVSGPRVLSPGERGVYTLVAPNVGSMPGVTQPFVLQAVTATPQTISSSGLFTPEPFESSISPSYVDRIVPLGSTVSLSVELRSPYGAPVHRRGVPVALGQVIYGQNTLIPGEAQIDDTPVGESPVIRLTNQSGEVTFRIRDSYVQGGNPVYFQAYVDSPDGFPYGYSEIVSVQWSAGHGASDSH
jgi:uncharacterized membrane protein